MPTVKSATRFMDRQGAAVLAVFIVSGCAMGGALSLHPGPVAERLLGVAWFVGTVGVMFWLLHRLGRGFRCPDCDGPVGPLLPTDNRPGTPLLRHCAHCDVLWKVGAETD